MNGTSTEEITAYVAAVRAALAGLPEATRDELLEDLPEHLAEVAADDVGSLVDRLGPPSVYAAELLAGAGYVGGFPDPPPKRDQVAELHAAVLRGVHAVTPESLSRLSIVAAKPAHTLPERWSSVRPASLSA